LDQFNSLGVIDKTGKYSISDITIIIDELKNLLNSTAVNKASVVEWLKKYIPEFEHIETGLKLDNKM
jgi:hypothetical protein